MKINNTLPIGIILLVIFSSCRREFELVDDRQVFRYNEAANITSLDPAFARDQANIWAVNQLYNGLVQLNDKLEVYPCIAKSWDITHHGLNYTFYLRNDVFFHDNPCFPDGKGRLVTASDFLYSFKRIINPETASAGSWVFNYLDTVQPFLVPDDSTFVVRLNHPFPPFLSLLSMQYCSVIPEEAVQMYGSAFRNNPVGTGPFRFAMWKEGVKLVLRKNPHYFEWDKGKQLPYLEAVAVTFLADKQASFLEFVKKKLDFISGIDPGYKDELLTRTGKLNPKYESLCYLITQPYLNTEYLGILVDTTLSALQNNPLRNRKIREAINYAFDRQKMIQYLRNGIGTPGIYGILPPGIPGFDSTRVYYRYNQEFAKKLLAEAGYKDGEGLPEITLISTPDYLDICKYIQHQVSELGIRMNIEISPPAAVKEMKSQAKIPFFRASWIADYPDAENYLSLFYSPNFCPKGPNYTHYRNPSYDKLFESALVTVVDSIRYGMYHQMEALMMQDAPVVILYYDQVLRFVQKNVSGLGSNPMNLLTLKRVRKS